MENSQSLFMVRTLISIVAYILTGVAVLFPKKVTLNPPWFEQLEATSNVKIVSGSVILNSPVEGRRYHFGQPNL